MTAHFTARGWRRLALAAPLLALLALAGCGSHGNAPTLGDSATVALVGAAGAKPLGSARFSPTYAAHIAAWYQGKAVPYEGAATPVELRQGSCAGKPLAALTAATAAPIADPLPLALDPKSGVDVAVATSGNLYVVVLQKANDASAPQLACGHPLSGLRQYFDLYTPGQGANGYSLGIALSEPIAATSVAVTLAAPAAAATTWAVRADSCDSKPLAQGSIAAGATQATGTVFAPLAPGHWRLTLASDGGQRVCATVGA